MKFILFVEGDTEKRALPAFLKKWLDQRLSQSVSIHPVRFNGWSELAKDAPKKAMLYLTGPQKDDIVGVIALLDLYGPTIYPSGKRTAKQRYEWAKGELEGKVNHDRFRQFFAVHETEAWLLSDPDLFPAEIRKELHIIPGTEVEFDVIGDTIYLKRKSSGQDLIAHLTGKATLPYTTEQIMEWTRGE
jgi:hypothetical protein